MGLFDTFKKLFHHPIDNTSAAEQTLPPVTIVLCRLRFHEKPLRTVHRQI